MLRFTILAVSLVAICGMSIDRRLKVAEGDLFIVDGLDESLAKVHQSLVESVPEEDNDKFTFRFGRRVDGETEKRRKFQNQSRNVHSKSSILR